ncbi:MFS transporter [Clostridium sp. P21]|uniref:MFS transporter n=1 Tax=Clostridium muellerianum TaxID=2716538 RepID=A0A7Y0EJD9_9CLOT|nr:MFS transporter [Clostridium muellerianum]NMM64573.1 MFS transporter [Clostridium muellerianum]
MKKIINQKILLRIIVALFWFAQYVYIPFQNPYLSMINVSANMIGTIIGSYGISQCLLRLPVGVLADSIGKHKCFILIGIAFAGLASFIRVIMPNSEGFLIANILSGIASSTWISYMIHYTGYFSYDDQQKGTSNIILVNNIGILAGFIVSTLFYDKLGMKALCVMSAASGMIGAVLALNIKEHQNQKINSNVPFSKYLLICTNKRLIFFSILALIQQGIQMSTTMSFTTQILKDLGATSLIVGLSSILYMISAVLSAGFASSKFCAKSGPKLWIPSVFSLISVYCILVSTLDSIPVIFLLQILPGMSTGILCSYLTSEAMKEVPQYQKSTAMGFFQAIYAIGMSIFPMFVGKIASSTSIKNGYFLLALLSIFGAAASVIYYKNFNTNILNQNDCIESNES